jgi:glycine dehydrogenase subunit 1
MRYIPNTDADRAAMLAAIGAESIDDLLADIPPRLRLKRPLRVPPALSEPDLLRHLRGLAARNADADRYVSYLGAGAYQHFIPSAVWALAGRGEFATSYTPYQPEISQGTLQAIYEFQTLICQLTGMDVANASLYDGSTALAEAALMAHRVNARPGFLISRAVHPEHRAVVATYARHLGGEIAEIPYDVKTGATDLAAARRLVSETTSAVLVQNPNFFGVIEPVEDLAAAAHARQAGCVVSVVEPVSLGLLKPPGECGADIAVGEAQGFGVGIQFGGPYVGFFATRTPYVRAMPGRLVGMTEDTEGRRGFVLTLATREQHIRREKATSNICTNTGLMALAATIHLTLLGRTGLRELATLNLRKAAHAKARLGRARGLTLPFAGPTFNEFVVRVGRRSPDEVNRRLAARGILGGLPLGRFYPELRDCLLLCVTERHAAEDLAALARALEGGSSPRSAQSTRRGKR